MSEKIKIQMFGIKDEMVAAPCCCGPSDNCGPSEEETTMEMYEALDKFLQETDVKEKYEMSFIDIKEVDLSNYENEKKVLDRGLERPVTFIAGRPAFKGKVDHFRAYQVVKRL